MARIHHDHIYRPRAFMFAVSLLVALYRCLWRLIRSWVYQRHLARPGGLLRHIAIPILISMAQRVRKQP